MSDQIQGEITSFIIDNFLFGESERVPAADESLLEEGIIDSTGILELIEFLEDRFGIQVTEAETVPENLGSISSLVVYVNSKRAAA